MGIFCVTQGAPPSGVGGSVAREGTYVYLWLTHADIWQKATQYCAAIILQLQIHKFKKKEIIQIPKTKATLKSLGSFSFEEEYIPFSTSRRF